MSEEKKIGLNETFRFVDDVVKMAEERGFDSRAFGFALIILNLGMYEAEANERGKEETIALFNLDMKKMREMFLDMINDKFKDA